MKYEIIVEARFKIEADTEDEARKLVASITNIGPFSTEDWRDGMTHWDIESTQEAE